MSTVNKEQIDKLMGDIASIKSVISKNRPLLKQLLLPVHFRIVSLAAGVSIVVFSLVLYFLIDAYGGYSAIPVGLRNGILVLIVAVYLLMGLLKRFFWVRSLKRIDRTFTFRQLVRELSTFSIYHTWIPIIVLTFFFILYLAFNDGARYIVPAAAFGLGLIYNSIGSSTDLKQYLVIGYWLLVTGALPILFGSFSALLALAVSIGGSQLIFVVISGPGKTSVVKED
ncbi:MAG: hypothetical protein GY866_18930 [Proteobacteria bacterium]|nr:hypothetical protein [Pseudomonadota bacterium]